MILVAWTLLASREFSQVAEYVELIMRHFDEFFEQDPSDTLVARRCGQ